MSNAQANIEAFKHRAATYDSEPKRRIAQNIARKILEFRFSDEEHGDLASDDIDVNPTLWNSKRTRVLDFGSGTGLLAAALAPYAVRIVGIDVSPEMVGIFNSKMDNHGIGEEEIHAYEYNLLEPQSELSVPLEGSFDVAVACLSYHHVDNPDSVTVSLANCLAPGGCLYVVDIMNPALHMSTEEAVKRGVSSQHGGDPHAYAKGFEQAGLDNVQISSIGSIKLRSHHSHNHGHEHHEHHKNHEHHEHHGHQAEHKPGSSGDHDSQGSHSHKSELFLIVGQKPGLTK